MAGPVIGDVSVNGRQTFYLGMRSKPFNQRMLAGEAISGSFTSTSHAFRGLGHETKAITSQTTVKMLPMALMTVMTSYRQLHAFYFCIICASRPTAMIHQSRTLAFCISYSDDGSTKQWQNRSKALHNCQ